MKQKSFYDLAVEHLEGISDCHIHESGSDELKEVGANVDDNVCITVDIETGTLRVYARGKKHKKEMVSIKKDSPVMQALNFLYEQITYDN